MKNKLSAPGKSGPAVFALNYPKPPLRNFTISRRKSITGKPSARADRLVRVFESFRRACADCFRSQLRRLGFGQPHQARPQRGCANIT